jgi:hypothetical protein
MTREYKLFIKDIAQSWNVLAISRFINRESNMKARENLLLVSEEGRIFYCTSSAFSFFMLWRIMVRRMKLLFAPPRSWIRLS